MANTDIELRSKGIRDVLIYTLALNLFVAISKIIYGYISGSVGMLSDGFHSLFDGVSNVLGLVGIWIASHPPDEQHPYGHRKFETLFTVIIGVMIFGTCLQVLRGVYNSFRYGHGVEVGWLSFIIMAFTLGVNLFVMLYESHMGKKLGSEFLIADAMHTKSDIFASVAVIAGLFFTRIGYPLADAIVGLIIVALIGRIGWRIIKSAASVMVDTICINTSLIESEVMGVAGVRGCHDIRTRGTEQYTYLDIHVLVDPRLTVAESHNIAEEVEKKIKAEFPQVVDIVVHIEPDEGGSAPRLFGDCIPSQTFDPSPLWELPIEGRGRCCRVTFYL
jgi:cation diffusion facilitator family transporter